MTGAVDDTAFHHEANILYHGNVRKRVARNSDDVGEIARLESADLIGPAKELGAVEQVSLQCGEWRHAVFDHENEFAGLRAVGKGADVRADRHGNSGSELPAELLGVKFLHAAFTYGRRGRSGVIGKVFGDR